MTEVASGLSDLQDFCFLPDGRMLLAQKAGRVWVRSTAGGLFQALDISAATDSAKDKGLLAIEPHPHFSDNGLIFIFYTRGTDNSSSSQSRVVTFQMQGDLINSATETVVVDGLLAPDNHNGGGLAVGADGFLYVSAGDTGCSSSSPPGQNISNYFGTCLTNPNGKILRVALDGAVPSNNPLASQNAVSACTDRCMATPPANTGAPRTDIFAWGFRNPTRIWVDPKTNLLWSNDQGETAFEEVDLVRSGRHYGWPYREGDAGQPASLCEGILPDAGPCTDPLFACRHDSTDGCFSLVGGAIADSCTWPAEWRNSYVFGDSQSQAIWALPIDAGRNGASGARKDFATMTGSPTSIRMGVDGNLYVALQSGTVIQIAPIAASECTQASDGGSSSNPRSVGGVAGGGTFSGNSASGLHCGCALVPSEAGIAGLLVGFVLWAARRRKEDRR